MQTLFAAEEVFHTETSKVYSELEAIIDRLAKDVQKGTLPKKILPKPQPIQSPSINSMNSMNNSTAIIPSNPNSPPKATNGTSSPTGRGYFGSSESELPIPGRRRGRTKLRRGRSYQCCGVRR